MHLYSLSFMCSPFSNIFLRFQFSFFFRVLILLSVFPFNLISFLSTDIPYSSWFYPFCDSFLFLFQISFFLGGGFQILILLLAFPSNLISFLDFPHLSIFLFLFQASFFFWSFICVAALSFSLLYIALYCNLFLVLFQNSFFCRLFFSNSEH